VISATIDMSGVQEGTACPLGTPSCPLATHLASTNRVLEVGVCACTTPNASRLFCAAIFLCDLSRWAAPALASHFMGPSHCVGPFSSRHSQSHPRS
jgi:hypothetical protein